MRFFLYILFSLFAFACHPLAEVADRVPAEVQCPPSDGADARHAIAAYAKDPEALRSGLTEQAKRDPLGVTCLLLDARTELLRTGKRASNVYDAVQEALAALGLE